MAYSDDAVKAKLSALNETQDSIVTVAQWIMFHRRHADRTASLWLTRLQESNTSKRLNLIYLANEVVQQSRARSKTDFLLAFEPLIADATSLAYKNASQEVQGKLKRVVEVWKQRGIFDPQIQSSTERRLKEIDESRGGGRANGGSGGGSRLGGSLFGSSSVPAELEGVSKSQTALTKADVAVKPSVNSANTEYAKMTDPNTPLPTPPVHAARLSALMKNLATAQGAVEASIKARKELIAGLEKLVESHRSKLAEDETTATDLATRKEGVEAKKKEVEDGIMRGLSAPSSPDIPTPTSAANGTSGANSKEIERPEAEGFTPPPPDIETFTPPAGQDMVTEEVTATGDPAPFFGEDNQEERMYASTTGAENIHELPPNLNEPPPSYELPPAFQSQDSRRASASANAAAAANDFLNSLNVGQIRQASAELPAAATNGNPGDPRLKRRKLSHKNSGDVDEDIFGAAGVGGVDEDGVGALLGQ